jgi:hypothetical protein
MLLSITYCRCYIRQLAKKKDAEFAGTNFCHCERVEGCQCCEAIS